MEYFVGITCIAAEIWMSHLILSGFFPSKNQSLKYQIMIYAVETIALAILSFFDVNAFFRLGGSLVLVWFMAATLFRSSPIRCIASAVVVCIVVALSDVFTSLLIIPFHVDTSVMMTDGTVRYIWSITSHFLMFGIAMCVYLLGRNRSKSASLRILLPVLPCWIASLALCICLAWDIFIRGVDVSSFYLFVLLGLLYTDIIIIYYINRLTAQEQEHLALELAEHHYIMQKEYYEQIQVQQEETRALWHDISKLLRAVKAESTDKAIGEIQQMLDAVSSVVEVNNRVVSVILNEYIQSARTVGIDVKLDISVPAELFVTAVDLYVILGNTLDNAIEACTSLPESERYITVKLKTHNNSILFYEIENPYSTEHTKRIRGKEHGYGLRNVRKCVEKYDGAIDVFHESGVFRFTAHLNNL